MIGLKSTTVTLLVLCALLLGSVTSRPAKKPLSERPGLVRGESESQNESEIESEIESERTASKDGVDSHGRKLGHGKNKHAILFRDSNEVAETTELETTPETIPETTPVTSPYRLTDDGIPILFSVKRPTRPTRPSVEKEDEEGEEEEAGQKGQPMTTPPASVETTTATAVGQPATVDDRFGLFELAPKCAEGFVLVVDRCRKMA